MFVAVLFATARTWKQPRCPLTDEWIKKMWCIHAMGYDSAIQKNGYESVRVRGMDLELVIQSEGSQENKYRVLTHAYRI